MSRILRVAQRLVLGNEEKIARRWQARLEDASRADRRAFLRALSIEPGRENVALGAIERSPGQWGWVGLLVDRLVGLHGVVAGASGSGKTSWLIGILLQIIAKLRLSLILPDFKGETVDLMLDVGIPFLLENGCDGDLLDNLRVIRPFDQRYVPLLNLTLPEAGVPAEAQAYGVASAVEQALAEPLGGRMHHCLVEMVVVCIELGLPITIIVEWLTNPRAFVVAASHSENEATRQYARVGFPQENRESLRALVARLNALLFWPGARRALCAPGAVSFADALAAPGITVISTGGAPAGSERLARFFAGALLGKVVRAILSRDITPDTPPALLVCEEVTEALGAEEARQLGRLLAIARYKRCGVWLSSQSRSMLAAVDPGLVSAIRANTSLHLQFRTSPEDAAAFAHLLPEEGEGEAGRREIINTLTTLPQRHCYLAVRDLGLKAQRVLAPRLDFAALRAAGSRLSTETRQRIEQGIAAVPLVDVPRLIAEPRANEVKSSEPAPIHDNKFPDLG